MKQTQYHLMQLWLCTWMVMAAPGAWAQAKTPWTQMQQSPAEVLNAFEPAEDQEYELGRGDDVTVTVNAMPDLSGKHVIGPDGRITLPLAGDVKLEGLTRSAAGAAVRTAYAAYYQNITVSVSVDRYASNHVLLLGAVEHPGLISFDGPPSLLETIARGGVGTSAASAAGGEGASSGSSARGGLPELCMIYRGKQTLVTVRVRDLVGSGEPGANLRLKRDDVVFVPGNDAYVSVFGSVLHPGLQKLERTSTLPELLAAAGGPTDKGGRYAKIYIVHPARGKIAGSIETVSFEDIVGAKLVHPLLESGDIIYLPENGFNRATDVLQKISPLISLITVGALLR